MTNKRGKSNSDSEPEESNKKTKLYIEAIEKAEREEFDGVKDKKEEDEHDIEIIEIKKKKDKTEKEKMIAGETYNYNDPQLKKERIECRRILKKINDSDPEEEDVREECFKKLFKKFGKQSYIEPPFRCDYGSNISIGDRWYLFYFIIFNIIIITIIYIYIYIYFFFFNSYLLKRSLTNIINIYILYNHDYIYI